MQPAARGTRADLDVPVSMLIGQQRERYVPGVKGEPRAASAPEVASARTMDSPPPGGPV